MAAVVNDEDRKCAVSTVQLSYETVDTDRLATRIAEYRERVEARANDKRIASLEAKLADAESARDHAISFQAANVARCERQEDALEKAERKIDAMSDPSRVPDSRAPAMCDRHRDHVEECRAYLLQRSPQSVYELQSRLSDLICVIDAICPPPKAPPTDAELAKLACDAADRAQHGTDAWRALTSIADALRARGAK